MAELNHDIFNLSGSASGAAASEGEAQWLLQHFNLPYNPFPPSGISPDYPEGPPLKNEQGQEIAPQIREFITSAYSSRMRQQGLVVIGAYGTGKSHLLRLMQTQINQYLGSGEEKALAIYIQRPRIEAQDINREILKSLGEDTIRKMLWFALRGEIAVDIETQSEALQALRDDLHGPLFASSIEGEFSTVFSQDNLADYRTFLAQFDQRQWPREALRDYIIDVFTRALEAQSPIEAAEAFAALLLAPDEKSRASWESLVALGKSRKVPLLAAPDFLADLLQLFKLNGYVYAFLLIDEFEEVPGGYLLSRRQRADYMYTLMEILNRIQDGLGLILAITSEAWEILAEEAPPLRERLPSVIRLGPLDTDSIRRLLQFYLDKARSDTGLKVQEALSPFSKETIQFIASQLPERTPRNVLQYAYQVLAYCVQNNISSLDLLTLETVRSMYLSMRSLDSSSRRHFNRG